MSEDGIQIYPKSTRKEGNASCKLETKIKIYKSSRTHLNKN